MSGSHSISEVSRIAGIPKDLLRMWERRYAYPAPTRDRNGDRVYSDQQVDKLIVIRQLVNQGKRPGKLIALDLSQLKALLQKPAVEFDADRLLALLKSGDAKALRDWFHTYLMAYGLRAFVHQVMAPANRLVGELWAGGELAIYQEHLYTEVMKSLLPQALAAHYRADGKLRVMLSTVPGEQHALGLLMVEALLRLGGAYVVSFGTEMPFRDIEQAAQSHAVDVIGLSFSSSFDIDDAIVMLSGLRQMIDPTTAIWVGGAAFDGSAETRMPQGVDLLDGLQGVEQALASWKGRAGRD